MQIVEQSLADFGIKNMGIYAEEVNLARAVPDLIDGLKPVQRRIMWATANLGKDFVKTARVVGDCFAAGTQVKLADGASIDIEDIIVGDVVATDVGPHEVTKTFVIPNRALYEVVTDRGVVHATEDQIFYCTDSNGLEVERTPLTLVSGDNIKTAQV